MIFTRASLKTLTEQLQKKLDVIGPEFQVKLSLGGGSFSDTNCKMKLEITVLNSDGTSESREALDFKKWASSFGLSPDDLYKEFKAGDYQFRIEGLLPSSRKYPILCSRLDNNKQYKLELSKVLRNLKPKRPDVVILKELGVIASDLSPENLSCDGELSQSQVQSRRMLLERQKSALLNELGRTPTFEEVKTYGLLT